MASKLPQVSFENIKVELPPRPSKGLLLVLNIAGRHDKLVSDSALLSGLGFTVATLDLVEPRDQEQVTGFPSKAIADALVELTQSQIGQDASLADKAPILLGAGDSAKLIYDVLAASPPGRFHAGISVNFCPQPERTAGESFALGDTSPRNQPTSNWFVFQTHPACDPKVAAHFIDQAANARHIDLPDDGRALKTQLRALLNWLDPKIPDQLASTTSVTDLPLKELRADHSTKPMFAIMLSGDGGWAAFDRGISSELVRSGLDTVGWNSLNYFWNPKSPEQTAQDLEHVIEAYAKNWSKSEALLIGYSFGADVLPFVVERLSPAARGRLRLIVLIGLSSNAAFEFHLSDWLGGPSVPDAWPTVPEIGRMAMRERIVCIYGSDEPDSACPAAAKLGVKAVRLTGDHHFGDNYQTIVDQIMGQLK